MKATIVTGFYDIGRENWDNFTMSHHTYIWWMRNILYAENTMAIFTEEKFVDDIAKERKEQDPGLNNTEFIVKPLEELDAYIRHYKPLEALMMSESFIKKKQFDVPEMLKPLYNIIMFNKVAWIKHASDNKLFDSDVYIWSDVGGIRKDKPELGLLWPNPEKVPDKLTFFSHHEELRIGNREFHALSQTRFLQGGCFIVPKRDVQFLYEEFNNTIQDCIGQEYIGSDEKIFDFCYLDNPDRFNLIKAEWREFETLLQ